MAPTWTVPGLLLLVPPLSFFVILQQNACLEIKKGPLFYIFGTVRHFPKEKFFRKFQVFFQKNVLRFLSLRYSADFRRSRLVILSTIAGII